MNLEVSENVWKIIGTGMAAVGYILFIGHRVGRVEAGLESNTDAIKALTARIDRLMVSK